MKNLILTIVVVVLSALSVQAQDSTEIKLIGKTWILHSVKMDNVPEVIVDSNEISTMSYYSDYTYKANSSKGYAEVGNMI